MKFVCNDCDSLVHENDVIIDSFDEGILFFCQNCYEKLKENEEAEE